MSQISGSRPNPIKSGVLRPSALNANAEASTKTCVLRAASFQVASTTADDEPSNSNAANSSDQSTATSTPVECNPFQLTTDNVDDKLKSTTTENGSADTSTKVDEKTDVLSMLSNNGMPKTNFFATAKSTIPTSSSTENSGFVFGQNIHERATGESVAESVKAEAESSNQSSSSGDLFAIGGKESDNTKQVEASVESLTKVARAYEESRVQKRKYEEVETFTGEEDEMNVLDVNSKLFTFVASNWEERGPGSLRVNDPKDKTKCSRVVFRTSGNLRVLLNTKVWPGMVVERPSQKSLRLTAIDSAGQIKIFLAMARPDDISNLYTALNKRIDLEKSREADNRPPTTNIVPPVTVVIDLDDGTTTTS